MVADGAFLSVEPLAADAHWTMFLRDGMELGTHKAIQGCASIYTHIYSGALQIIFEISKKHIYTGAYIYWNTKQNFKKTKIFSIKTLLKSLKIMNFRRKT